MKTWVKGGLIGFLIIFAGLWIFALATSSPINPNIRNGWGCPNPVHRLDGCSFLEFSFLSLFFIIPLSLIGSIFGILIVLTNEGRKKINKKYGKIK